MYALVEIQGKQYKAEKDALLQVDKLDSAEGSTLDFDKVLMISEEGSTPKLGAPYLEGAKVSVEVEQQIKGKKIRIFKFKRRKGYRRTQGHRQQYSLVRVKSITA